MRSKNIDYLVGVDQLRAVAALLVLLYHGTQLLTAKVVYDAPFNPDLHWPAAVDPFRAVVVEGHTGVGLFMVLSGFIFTYGLLGRRISYLGFLRNRFVRIYPLYVFLLIAGIYATSDVDFSLDRLLVSLLPLANTPGALQLGNWSAMFWTISVEWQFYLLFPLLLPLFSGRRFGFLAQLALLLLLVRVAVAATPDANEQFLLYFSILGRMDQFLLGMLAAYLLRTRGAEVSARAGWITLAGVGMVWGLLVGVNQVFGGAPFLGRYAVVWHTLEGAAWATVILGYVAFAQRNKLVQALPGRLLARAGTWSYSVYLVHFVLLGFLVERDVFIALTGRPWADALVTSLVVVLPCTLAVAALTYQVIEKPFLRLRGRYVLPDPPAEEPRTPNATGRDGAVEREAEPALTGQTVATSEPDSAR